MGSCIICGTSVDGRICDLHEQDVVFEFRGSHPNELTPGRFYRGTVDGYAEFGVFVDIGDSVTGLLHRSEIDQRLDSLDWEPGDAVFVEVKNVRDNGNVDLGWSIRQAETEFRGTLIDDPDDDHERLADPEEDEPSDDDEADEATATDSPTAESGDGGAPTEDDSDTPSGSPTSDGGNQALEQHPTQTDSAAAPDQAAVAETAAAPADETETDLQQVTVDTLADRVGDRVRIEGEIADARQTSGPTVFQVRDETGTVHCAAFEEAGVRAYPEVGEGDVIRLEGEVERRRGDLQIETEALVLLEEEARSAVTERMEDALVKRATPAEVEPLAEDAAVAGVREQVRDAATAIRRAVLEARPIVVRHSTTADGYAAGVAIERATLPLIREEHTGADAEYHFFDRRPLEGSVYDLDDATKDVTGMLSNRERHDEKLPLFVFAGVGGSAASLDSFDLLDVYGARSVVVDHGEVADAVAETVDVVASPSRADGGDTTATALAANVAAHVNEDVREDIGHLPAVSFWEETPAAYADLAADSGYDADAVREIREAVALEAYYHSYEDKRELIIDLLFPAEETEADATGLAGHVSRQFRTKMDAEVTTAEANLARESLDGETVLVLDTDAFTHRYEFPPTPLLLDELHRRHRDEAAAVVGIDTDELYVRTDAAIDVTALAETAAETATAAGIEAASPREGRVEFLAGERDATRDAVLAALAEQL